MSERLHVFVDVENIRRALLHKPQASGQLALDVRFLADYIKVRLSRLSHIEYEIPSGGIVLVTGHTRNAVRDHQSQAGLRLDQLLRFWRGDDSLVEVETIGLRSKKPYCQAHQEPCECPTGPHIPENLKQQKVDMTIGVKLIETAHRYPRATFVLASADGDFAPAVQYVKRLRPKKPLGVATFGANPVAREVYCLKMPSHEPEFVNQAIAWLPPI